MKALLITLSAIALIGVSTPVTATPGGGSPSIDDPGHHARSTPTAFATKPKPGTKARCPVLKSTFTIRASSKFSLYKGRYYFFCCPGCKPKFDANPSKYAGR